MNACKESKTQDLDISATIIAAAALVELAEDSPSNRKIGSKQSRKLQGRVKSRFLMKVSTECVLVIQLLLMHLFASC